VIPMQKLLGQILVVAIILIFSLPCSASVIWTLNNFTFDDGATAVGQFEWDPVNNLVTSWNIDILPVYADPVLVDSPGNYSDTNSSAIPYGLIPSETYLIFSSLTNRHPTDPRRAWNFRVGINSFDILDTGVPHLDVEPQGGFAGPNGYLECLDCVDSRIGLAGAYLSASVREPATLALVATGLLGFVFSKRRRLTSNKWEQAAVF
jgi:hypothetical protein